MKEAFQRNVNQPFMLGEWEVDPEGSRLRCDKKEIKLEPKVMQVLLCLAQEPGKVVSRDELEATVWSGVVVGYDSIVGSVIKLRKALGDDSRNPRYIETVSKKGYRLLVDINPDTRSSALKQVTETTRQSMARPTDLHKTRGPLLYIGIAIITLGVFLSAWFYKDASNLASIDNKVPSIVVLPFNNLSDDTEQVYISEALTDDLITDLSKLKSLRVIARQSSYHYLERKDFTLEDVANELGVQYVVQGSVLKANERIRINIHITHTNKGESIWAERFDINQSDIFKLQDDITRQVIKALYIKPSQKESINIGARSSMNFESYDAFLLGQKYFKNRSREGFESAMQAYQRAIELDPNYARAYGAMAVALIRGNRGRWTELSNEEAKSRALELVKKAVSLNQTSPEVYWALGFVHLYRNEYEKAEAAARQTVVLSPNYADGYGLLAFISNWRGKSEQAENYIRKAIDLNPYYTFDYPWNLGLSFYYQGRYEEAVTQLNAALERNLTALYPRIFLAASYVRLGQLSDAEWEIEQITTNRVEATLSDLGSQLPFENKQNLEKVLEDLRKAGLPEK